MPARDLKLAPPGLLRDHLCLIQPIADTVLTDLHWSPIQ